MDCIDPLLISWPLESLFNDSSCGFVVIPNSPDLRHREFEFRAEAYRKTFEED
jgi:hypothetical protein